MEKERKYSQEKQGRHSETKHNRNFWKNCTVKQNVGIVDAKKEPICHRNTTPEITQHRAAVPLALSIHDCWLRWRLQCELNVMCNGFLYKCKLPWQLWCPQVGYLSLKTVIKDKKKRLLPRPEHHSCIRQSQRRQNLYPLFSHSRIVI